MNILVLCGGKSAERDVSCVSAAAILRHLPRRYRPRLVHIDARGAWRLQKDPRAFARHPRPFRYPFDRIPVRLEPGTPPRFVSGDRALQVDLVFPVLHGPMGEDGTVQGLLELLGLPYVGCGVLGSAVGMDKVLTKRLALQAGLPILPYVALEPKEPLSRARRLGFPLFVKPSRMGSSVGVSKVSRPRDLAGAVRRAFRFDTTVIVERGIAAREIECAVLGGAGRVEASSVGEIRPNAEFYSYAAKYLDAKGAELIVPARIPAGLSRRVQAMSKAAFRTLGCHGLARVDFLMDRSSGRIWFNEINTMPGFTSISMYPRLWEHSGLPFPRLLERLIRLALLRHRERSRLRVTRD